MSRLILDVMGGDQAPKSILDGALLALPKLRRHLVLIGDEKIIRAHKIAKHLGPNLSIIHANETIEMTDKVKSIRSKPNAPINVGNKLAAESFENYKQGKGTPDAFISAGHSGAMMASALFGMGRIRGFERPGIAAKLPTVNGRGVVCLDVGANVDCKPEHLRDFAVMGCLYAAAMGPGLKKPKVGLLSNGEERTKGTEVLRTTLALLEGDPRFSGPHAIGDFVGFAEGKEVFRGDVDVIVMDGFVGNLILKNSEALAMTIVNLLKQEAKKNLFNMLGFSMAFSAFKSLKRRIDYRETGAAPLLGVNGYAFIAHGRSDKRAIRSALVRAQEALDAKMIESLDEASMAASVPAGAGTTPAANTSSTANTPPKDGALS